MGMAKFWPLVAPKALNGLQRKLEYMTRSGVRTYKDIRKFAWRCNNVGGLGEQVTCHMSMVS